MNEIIDFVFSIPWYMWIVAIIWYAIASNHWENNRRKRMTPEELAEYNEKIRRKGLGLD